MKNRRAVRWLLPGLFVIAVAYVLICGSHVFANKVDQDVSPKGYYRLEYLKPGFPFLLRITKQMPRIIRLYDNRSGKLLGESDIVDLNGNGEIFWASKDNPNIRIGMDVAFPASPEPE
jgi:hypothetical protein